MASNRLYRKVSQPYFARKAEGAGDNDTSEYLKEQEDGTVVLGKENENKVLLTENDGVEFQIYGSESETPHELKMIPINDTRIFFGDPNLYVSSNNYFGMVFSHENDDFLSGIVQLDSNFERYTGAGYLECNGPSGRSIFEVDDIAFYFIGANIYGSLYGEYNSEDKSDYSLKFYLDEYDKEINFNIVTDSNDLQGVLKSFDIKVNDVSLVEANPSTTESSETLTSIGIGGTNYKLPSGGSSSGGMESFTFPKSISFEKDSEENATFDYYIGEYHFDTRDAFDAFREKMVNGTIIAYIWPNTNPYSQIMITSWYDLVGQTGGNLIYLYAYDINATTNKIRHYSLYVRG